MYMNTGIMIKLQMSNVADFINLSVKLFKFIVKLLCLWHYNLNFKMMIKKKLNLHAVFA